MHLTGWPATGPAAPGQDPDRVRFHFTTYIDNNQYFHQTGILDDFVDPNTPLGSHNMYPIVAWAGAAGPVAGQPVKCIMFGWDERD